jgi:hypothetical protein
MWRPRRKTSQPFASDRNSFTILQIPCRTRGISLEPPNPHVQNARKRNAGTHSDNCSAFHQRSRRPPPPPRPPRSPRSRPPPPARSVFGRASFTLSVRPPTWEPFKAAIAFSPSSLLAISTNPKPRDRPVSRSVMILTRSTCPYVSKSCRSSSSLVLKLRFPTKIFFTSCAPALSCRKCKLSSADLAGREGLPEIETGAGEQSNAGRSIAGLCEYSCQMRHQFKSKAAIVFCSTFADSRNWPASFSLNSSRNTRLMPPPSTTVGRLKQTLLIPQ